MTSLRVVTLNALLGGEDRFERIVALVRGWTPDLLVVQECIGWDEGNRLATIAAAISVPEDPRHVHLGRARPRGSGRRFHVAVLSRRPMLRAVEHADPAVLGHCLVECDVAIDGGETLTVLGAHFDAHGEDQRLVEARFVNERAAGRLAGGLALLAGDLNALCRHDPYPADLAEKVARAGTDKYGHPPRFDAIAELEAAGWVDALRRRPTDPEWVTARRDRGGVQIDYRTDYVLASPRLADALVGARVLPVGVASDHDAVEATFQI